MFCNNSFQLLAVQIWFKHFRWTKFVVLVHLSAFDVFCNISYDICYIQKEVESAAHFPVQCRPCPGLRPNSIYIPANAHFLMYFSSFLVYYNFGKVYAGHMQRHCGIVFLAGKSTNFIDAKNFSLN